MNMIAFRRNCFLRHFWVLLTAFRLASTLVLAEYIGNTYPRHAEIAIGRDVNITCRLNTTYFNETSSCLTFSEEYSNTTVPKEHILIKNETSIVYMIRNATEQSTRYICKCNKSGVDASNVDVGTPPTNVTDFQCRGYDFSYMTCNFTVPENKILTHYKLSFTTFSPDYKYECKLENGALPSERICNITMDNGYRIVHQYYTFKLTANNSLGTSTQSIPVDHHARIVPAKPAVEIGNITAHSVTLSWIVTKFSHYSNTNGLHYEIRLRPDKFDWIDIDTKMVQSNGKDFFIEIGNLKYAFRRYDVIVRVKTERSPNDGTMWSEPLVGSFNTSPEPPDNSPAIDVGSFYIDPTEQNLRLYWQQIPEWQENGPDFQYVITEIRQDGNVVNILPTHMDETSVTYKWQSTSDYEFKVKSQNHVGQSVNPSVLRIPPSRKRSIELEQIQTITKVYHNQSYTVSWWQPNDMQNLIDFTVFWCISKMESQSQCKGTIHSQHFDRTTYNYTTEPQNHTLNFAVSANYRNYSTGMIWAMCTADVATDLTKMDPETTALSSDRIKIQWSTECLYTAILEGYNLTYCKVENNVSEKVGDCISPEKTIIISKQAKEFTISGLEPFTTYKILILMYSKVKVGPVSNPVLETTTEDAPTPPRQLKYDNVTSNSVVVSWLPPKHSNGNLRHYTVWQNTDFHTVNTTNNDTENIITFKLENLSSFSDYKIYVTAHTVKSSAPSNDIHIKTLIGYPSAPRLLNMNISDNSLVLSWATPIVPSGRVEFYEVRVNIWKNNETEPSKIARVASNVCRIHLPQCNDPSYTYKFHVRAVNVAEKSEVDYHKFSKRDTSDYATIHQGSPKRRRHSNAEINSSIGGAYLIHEPAERHLRHRHERENLKPISASRTESLKPSETSPVIPNSFEIRDEILYDNTEEFVCIGSKPVPQRYNDAYKYKLFASGWENGQYYACGDAQLSKITVLALVVIVISLIMFAALYSARKKYHKMRNIGVTLPEGLGENKHAPKGVDNTIEHDEITRSDELLYVKERLLSKIGNDSGILNSARSLDKNSAYVCSDHQDSEKSSQSTDSVELNDITSCSYSSSPSHSPNANVRAAATIDADFTPSIIKPISVQLPPHTENNMFKPMIMSNGYVQPQAFQKLQAPSFNGYTTLDAMGKPMFPHVSATVAPTLGDSSFGLNSKTFSNKDVPMPQPLNGNISGYVTCKQLSDFGQSLQ